MIDKVIEKIGAKAFAALSSLVTALVVYLLHKIDKYFTKKKYFQKGKEAAKKEWEEQEKFWKKKVLDIKESTDLTIKEKIEELKRLKKAFEDYVRKNEGK
jgi:hypothetical protein